MDEKEIDRILRKIDPYIRRKILSKMLRQPENTRDIIYDKVVDGIVKALKAEKIKRKYGDASVFSFARRVIINKCNDYFREPQRAEKRYLKRPVTAAANGYDPNWGYELLYQRSIRKDNEGKLTEYEISRVLAKIGLIEKIGFDTLPVAIKLIQGEKRHEISKNLDLTDNQTKWKIEQSWRKLRHRSVERALREIVKSRQKDFKRKNFKVF